MTNLATFASDDLLSRCCMAKDFGWLFELFQPPVTSIFRHADERSWIFAGVVVISSFDSILEFVDRFLHTNRK